MNITVFGIGYVGLVQAAALAQVGHVVVCVDVDAARVEALGKGEVPIYEPGLEELVKEGRAAGTLRFTTDAGEGVRHGRAQFIAVGTPPGEDGGADLRHVLAVATSIGREMDGPVLVASKSTVPVGTSERVGEHIRAELARRGREELEVEVVSNPEFLKEGSAVADCQRPERIIVGSDSPGAEALMREIYAPFNRNHDKIIVMDPRSAELTKYAANCMLATKISFMNEMAGLAEALGADIEQVRLGIGSDPRIGYHFIYPGLGYGGSCFPKDIRALIRTAEDIAFAPRVLEAVEERNNAQKRILLAKIAARFGDDLAGMTFAVWGLAFKPDTNDMREAPARVLMEALWQAGAAVRAYDPEAMDECRRIYGERDDLVLCESKEAALEGADALVIATEWKMFRAPPVALISATLATPVVFDGRNLYDPELMRRHGIEYHGIGRETPGARHAADAPAAKTA